MPYRQLRIGEVFEQFDGEISNQNKHVLDKSKNISVYMRFINALNELKLFGLIEESINNHVIIFS